MLNQCKSVVVLYVYDPHKGLNGALCNVHLALFVGRVTHPIGKDHRLVN